MINSEITTATKSTQRLRVMLHLKAGQTLTSLEALRLYGIMRLPNRISELRKRGERIEKTTITVLNKYGEAVRVAEYRLQDIETDRAGKPSKTPHSEQDGAADISSRDGEAGRTSENAALYNPISGEKRAGRRI